MNRKFNKNIVFVLFIIVLSCENNITNPCDNSNTVLNVSTPRQAKPEMYIPFNFERKMLGITIIDTIIAQPPSSMNVTITTLSGDIEDFTLSYIVGSFNGDYFGFSGEIRFIMTENDAQIKNGLLELNSIIEKVTVSYKSFNDSLQKDYSIIISDSIPFYPRRWFDRLP
jgi:hypothetical protein